MLKYTLTVDGMTCSMCESHVNDCIRKHFPVDKVTSSHKKAQTEIISESPISESELKTAIESTGYKVLSITSEPYEKKKKRFIFF